jgi:hypothetical protein
MRNLKADDQLLRHALATNFQRVICGGAVSCLTSDKGLGRVKTLVKEGQDWERQRGEEVARRAYAVSAAISCLAPMMFITLVRL